MNETFSASGFKRIRLGERESGRVRKTVFLSGMLERA